MKERDVIRAAQPLEPRRGSTVEMVDRIRAEEAKARQTEPKEQPRGR